VKINRTETMTVDKELLPGDAVFKGYEEVIVQDLKIETDNILFLKEKYYSAAEQKTYMAQLPKGYHGQFGPTIRALTISLYYGGGMSEPKVIDFFEQIGVNIGDGTISDIVSKNNESWHQEADEIIIAGLSSSNSQHLDDTGTRVNGVNQYCHILCNPFYTAYATRVHKNRMTVIAVLQNSDEAVCCFNEQTEQWLKTFKVPQWARKQIDQWPQGQILKEEEVAKLLESSGMSERLNGQQQARIREAGALTAYYNQTKYPVIPILVSDDAPQFQHITEYQMLCWVHEGRHYKKLEPQVPYHQEILATFLKDFWEYYHELQAYKAEPTPEKAKELNLEFDALFSSLTDYDQLNKRIEKTMAHKKKLLVVLEHPEVALHNNSAELGARQRVRKRDVSFGPRTDDGKKSWDSFMTIAETAKKLGVSFYHYVFDRVSETNALPSLAELIRARGQPDLTTG